MKAPTWPRYMAPSLRFLSDGQVAKARDIVRAAGDGVELTEEQRAATIPSGQLQWINRGNWALSHLTRAGSLQRPARGLYQITEVGRQLLAKHPEGMTERDLIALSDNPHAKRVFTAFAAPQNDATIEPVDEEESVLDPEEQIATGIARINADVADQLLTRVLAQEPVFFEEAVLRLLLAMGYGGAEGSAQRTKITGDGGIDGVIDQDALGLSRIYVQAKRYAPDNIVGRPAIQAFVGALAGNQANQGVFITTSGFSREAASYAEQVPTRIILIDGERLTRLMIGYGVGVQVKRAVQIVQVDEDFFEWGT